MFGRAYILRRFDGAVLVLELAFRMVPLADAAGAAGTTPSCWTALWASLPLSFCPCLRFAAVLQTTLSERRANSLVIQVDIAKGAGKSSTRNSS
jgi:hypothetical protein